MGAAEESNLLVGEKARGGNLLDLAPVLAMGAEGDVRRAVEEDLCDRGAGAGREDMVVSAQDGLRRGRRGDEEGWEGAEAEEQEPVAAVLGGEVAGGDVREGAGEEVQVADDGETRRRRQLAQQPLPGPLGGRCREAAHEQDEEREGEQDGNG